MINQTTNLKKNEISTPNIQINDLPYEIILHIFSYLNGIDLLCSTLFLSQKFKVISKEAFLLKLKNSSVQFIFDSKQWCKHFETGIFNTDYDDFSSFPIENLFKAVTGMAQIQAKFNSSKIDDIFNNICIIKIPTKICGMPLNLKNFGIFLKNFNDGKIAYDDILASLNNFQNCTAKVSDTGYGFVLEKLLNDEKGTINTAEKTYWIVAPFFSLSKTFHQYPVDRKSLFKDYSEFSYPNALEAAILTFLKNYIYPSNEMYGSKKFGTCQTGHTNFHCFDDSQVVHFGMSKEGKICIDPPFYRKAASCSASTTAIFRLYTQAS